MGLINNAGEEKYAVLSDILADEDHLGDMDFKGTGTPVSYTHLVDGDLLERQYRNHLSGYLHWDQLVHA